MWDQIAQTLLAVCHDVSLGEGSDAAGQLRELLDCYLDENPPERSLDEDTARANAAWINEDGFACIFGSGFSEWLNRSKNISYTPHQYGKLMRMLGARPFVQSIPANGRRSTRSSWVLPFLGSDWNGNNGR